jgi:hypothetical protein
MKDPIIVWDEEFITETYDDGQVTELRYLFKELTRLKLIERIGNSYALTAKGRRLKNEQPQKWGSTGPLALQHWPDSID